MAPWDMDEDEDKVSLGKGASPPSYRSGDSLSGSVKKEEDGIVDVHASAPKDKYYLVFGIILLNGIGVLLPWNMFITIAPDYYVSHWFSFYSNGSHSIDPDHYGKQFQSALGVASQVPNFLMGLVSVLAIIKGPLVWRIYGSISINTILVAVVLVLVCAVQPSVGAEQWFFIVNLTIVMLLNASNGMYQNSVFGLAADFPATYINALVVGNNICGTFTSVLQIVCTLAFPDNTQTVGIIYFSISLFVIILCLFSLFFAAKLDFYNYYFQKGEEARKSSASVRPSLSQYIETFKYCWVQFLNVFLVYFVTLSVFPTVLSNIPHSATFGKTFDSIWVTLTTFLNFNLFAAFGSLTASFVQFPPPKLLCIPVYARLLFIPFFMFCNYDPLYRHMPVWFKNAWFFIIGNTIMAYTSGYFSSLGMMYAPQNAPPHLQKIAGQLSALALVGGIMAGSGFTYAITAMVENF